MADSDDDSSKTEEPTAKKLDDARKKGEVVVSREISHWFMIFGGTLFVMMIAGDTMRTLGQSLMPLIAKPHDIMVSNMGEIAIVLSSLIKTTIMALIMPFLVFVIAAIAGPLLQVGPLWAPDNFMPKLERISIMSGIGRMFSKRNVLEFVKGLLKLSIVAIVVIWLTLPTAPTIEHMMDVGMLGQLLALKKYSLRIMGGVLAIMFIIAVIDYVAQRYMFIARLRMSRSELKEEFKQSEGDPQIKQKLRQIRAERSRRRMMASVPTADVVITNPEHYAVALKYNPPEDAAPVVVAMGQDNIAQIIKKVAKENDVPIIENPPLARALYATAELDRQIPGEHYKAVAEIITYVFKLKNRIVQAKPKS